MLVEKQKIVLPKAEALWPKLVEPDNYEGSLDYKVSLILDPSEAGVQELLDEITETAEAQLFKAKAELTKKGGANIKKASELKCSLPFAPEYEQDGSETGRYILKAKSKAAGVTAAGKKWERKIPLFDAGTSGKVKPIPHGSVGIFSGSILKVEVVANPYIALGLKIAGLSFYINAVQVIELSGGGGGGSFGCEEGGFDASDIPEESENPAPYHQDSDHEMDF